MKKGKKLNLEEIKQFQKRYKSDGIDIIGVFGSIAKNNDDIYSDIDIAYQINHKLFSSKYKDGFSQILKIEDIKNELQKSLKKKVDFVPLNDKIKKDIIYV